MASCTIPSCQINAANTALVASATDGDIASFTGSLCLSLGMDPDLDRLVGVLLSLATGDAALSLLDLRVLPLSFLLFLGDTLKCTIKKKS